jgi:hypothetical protein
LDNSNICIISKRIRLFLLFFFFFLLLHWISFKIPLLFCVSILFYVKCSKFVIKREAF